MLDKINALYHTLTVVIQGNQMLAAGLGVYGLSAFMYVFKDIPLKVLNFIKKETTTTLTINSQDQVFYDFLQVIEDSTLTTLVCDWNFNNGKGYFYYNNRGPKITIGYGTTYAFWLKKLLIINRFKVEASQTAESKEIIHVTSLGRNRDVFLKIFNKIELSKTEIVNDKVTNIKIFKDNFWVKSCESPKRSIESVIIPNKNKEVILKHINNFKNSREWYLLNGVPYRTGILLEGPPGTGKTTLVRALAAHFNMDLHYFDATECHPGKIKEALRQLPQDSLMVIEEIDRMFAPSQMELSKEGAEVLVGSELLNAIDGILGSENRILIATTNHLDKLDEALTREGRFDLKVHVGYMTDETLRNYMDRMYPDFRESHLYSVKDSVAPCLVQKLVFDNKDNPHSVLEKVAVKNHRYLALDTISQ